MKVAVVGCAHGELDKIYDTIAFLEQQEAVKIDLVLCCGDFQATRNLSDLACMSVPNKYKSMGSFYKYYSGEKKAPILTIFIGGNHEASNYLQELEYGGWAAPNIYYLGYAGVVNVGGIRIGGLSGIYKHSDFMTGHHEKLPYNEGTKRTVYHVRNVDVFRLKQLSGNIDAFLSHDWPAGIHQYGDADNLMRLKPFFRQDITNNQLGSEASSKLLHTLKPKFWFSAHLHVKFVALVPHDNGTNDDRYSDKNNFTHFLALDKCLPNRNFLQVVDIPSKNEKAEVELEYDLEWLTILYLTNHLVTYKNGIQFMPGPSSKQRSHFTPSKEEKDLVLERFNGNLKIPENFTLTATPVERTERNSSRRIDQLMMYTNPQTRRFCDILRLKDMAKVLGDVNVATCSSMEQESQDTSMNRQSLNNTRGVDNSSSSFVTEDYSSFSTFLANQPFDNSESSINTSDGSGNSQSKIESDNTTVDDSMNSTSKMELDKDDSVRSESKIMPDDDTKDDSVHTESKGKADSDTKDDSVHSESKGKVDSDTKDDSIHSESKGKADSDTKNDLVPSESKGKADSDTKDDLEHSECKINPDNVTADEPVYLPNEIKPLNATKDDLVYLPIEIKPYNYARDDSVYLPSEKPYTFEQSMYCASKAGSSSASFEEAMRLSGKTDSSNTKLEQSAHSSDTESSVSLLNRSLLSLPSPKFSAEMFLDDPDKPTSNLFGKAKMSAEVWPSLHNSKFPSPVATSEIQAGSKDTPKKACLEVHDKDALWLRFKRIDSVIQSAAAKKPEIKPKQPEYGYGFKSWSRPDMKYDRQSALRARTINSQISSQPRSMYSCGNPTFQTPVTAERPETVEAIQDRTEIDLQSPPASKSSDLTHYSASSVDYSPEAMFQSRSSSQYTGRDSVLCSYSTMNYVRPDYGFPSSTTLDAGNTLQDSISQNSSAPGLAHKRPNSVFDNFAVPSPRYKRMDSGYLPPTATDIRKMRASTVFPSITTQESQATTDPRFLRTESVIQGPISSSPKYTQPKTTTTCATTNSVTTPEVKLSVVESVIKSITAVEGSFVRRNQNFYSSEEEK